MASHIDEWCEFHLDNPHVYDKLVSLAREARRKGHKKIGIKMLFEVVRWEHMMKTSDAHSSFKLNNNYHSYYARLIMSENPDLAGIFETRTLKP